MCYSFNISSLVTFVSSVTGNSNRERPEDYHIHLAANIRVTPPCMKSKLNIEVSYKWRNGSPENGITRSSLNEGKMVSNKGSFCLPITLTKMLVLRYR